MPLPNISGTFPAIIYFRRIEADPVTGSHPLMWAPDNRHPTPAGWERMEAHNWREVDNATKIINAQDQDFYEKLFANDLIAMTASHSRIRGRLSVRMMEPDCGPGERLFILRSFDHMKMREEKLAKVKVTGWVHAREYDHAHKNCEPSGSQVPVRRMSDLLAQRMGR